MPATTLSVVIPVTRAVTDLAPVIAGYRDVLDRLARSYELICVVSHFDAALAPEDGLGTDPEVRMMRVPMHFGEMSCIREGVRRAVAGDILILPPFFQVDASAIPDILVALASVDLVITSRDRRGDALVNRARGSAFRFFSRLAGSRFDDLGCGVRAGRREVFEDVVVQDSQHNFLPILAERAGFTVVQLTVPQAAGDVRYRSHALSAYGGRLLDVLSVGFIVQFLQKPFRFFGSIGAAAIAMGLLLGLILVFQRGAGGVPMADRPALLLSVMLVVLGIQIAAVGLIAEVVLFTRLSANAVYRVREIIERRPDDAAGASAAEPAR